MKICLLLVSLAMFVSGNPVDENSKGRWIYVPDYDGNLYWANAEAPIVEPLRFDPFKDVSLHVYTRKNPTTADVVRNGNIPLLAKTNLDTSKPVKIVIHGWINKSKSEVNQMINGAFQKAMDVNVIVVDWSQGAATIDYFAAAARVPGVGRFVATVIDWLVEQGVPLSNFHIIGHSLGAHVSGFAGRNVKSGKVAYITGMDPAKPDWEFATSYGDGIRQSDGDYVEIIHTNTLVLGIRTPVGHVDFYPNGGTNQRGCLTNTCGHLRAYKFFAESIDHRGFMGQRCTDWLQASLERCSGSKLHMGAAQPKNTFGIYHLKTNYFSPYHQG